MKPPWLRKKTHLGAVPHLFNTVLSTSRFPQEVPGAVLKKPQIIQWKKKNNKPLKTKPKTQDEPKTQ